MFKDFIIIRHLKVLRIIFSLFRPMFISVFKSCRTSTILKTLCQPQDVAAKIFVHSAEFSFSS
jgi:hypothetical protein